MPDIDLGKTDPNFMRELTKRPGGERISACLTCQTCVASCPITEVNGTFNPARIIRMTLYGLREEVLGGDFIWLCTSCYACQERCPQGVRITEFMTQLKNMAVEAGYIPSGVKAQLDLVTGQGRIYPIDDFDNKKRNKIDLPSLPTSCDVVEKIFPKEG
ncbi:MAG: 4Fe-4S dicluster domain-containing protein [Deltaproteobacteria bacterium]|nr:4Fe-4S dicluster domain-containing protein [Deltaproteobacteria bacterium]